MSAGIGRRGGEIEDDYRELLATGIVATHPSFVHGDYEGVNPEWMEQFVEPWFSALGERATRDGLLISTAVERDGWVDFRVYAEVALVRPGGECYDRRQLWDAGGGGNGGLAAIERALLEDWGDALITARVRVAPQARRASG